MTARTPLFDPRTVPVLQVDHDLEVVAPTLLQPHALRQRFARPPPWEPEVCSEPSFSDRAPAHAAVLVPLVMREELMVLLTQRTAHLSSHSGQIAFPGGKSDPHDADAIDTALREAYEEIGLPRSAVEVIGSMPVYTTGSGFWVTPVVALVQADHALTLSPDEVADAFEVPLAFLMNPAHHRQHRWEGQGVVRQWFSMPYHDGREERFIWGATAGMLRNLYRFMVA
jgi:8-oxo-dGTP pyrophosphatase MutT (NUDIX family)